MMEPCFPQSSRRAFLRFEKQVYRAMADLAESLAASFFLEYAVRAEADAELEELLRQDALRDDGADGARPRPHGARPRPEGCPFAGAHRPFDMDAAGAVSPGCGGCQRCPRAARGCDGPKYGV